MQEIRKRPFLERILRREVVWGGYALADLAEPHFARTKWYFDGEDEGEEGADYGLVMAYRFDEYVTIMAFGPSAERVAGIIAEIEPGDNCDLHIHADHYDVVRRLFKKGKKNLEPYWRLGLRPSSVIQIDQVANDLEIRRLLKADVPAASALYAEHFPKNFFMPKRVKSDVYLGGFRGGELVAVAGTHVVSREQGIAAVGDVVVAPACRGEGIGATITSALCNYHFLRCGLLVLNVADANVAARRAYAKIGFGEGVLHYEGFGMQRRHCAR